jgi:hypothetical protein
MYLGYDKYMLRGQGMDIAESNYLFILIEKFRWYLTGNNFTEDAISQSNARPQICAKSLKEFSLSAHPLIVGE